MNVTAPASAAASAASPLPEGLTDGMLATLTFANHLGDEPFERPGQALVQYTPVGGTGAAGFEAALTAAQQASQASGTSDAVAVAQARDGSFHLNLVGTRSDGMVVPEQIDGPDFADNFQWVQATRQHDSLKAIVGESSWIDLREQTSARPQPLAEAPAALPQTPSTVTSPTDGGYGYGNRY